VSGSTFGHASLECLYDTLVCFLVKVHLMKVSYGVKDLDFVVDLRSLLVALLDLLVALS
jgi:hypothetical protein